MDLTHELDELLQKRGAPPTKKQVTLENIDGFLKEALRINSHIVKLHQNLRSVRRAYLARSQPRKGHGGAEDGPAVLSDRDREAVDKDAKEMMRELNWSIEALDGAEKIRHETETTAIQKKYGGGLGALGSWAAGGIVSSSKAPEQLEAEAQSQEIKTHRDGVLWYLRQRLQLCGQTQKSMMEARLRREVEMNRTLGSQSLNMADFADFAPTKKTTAPDLDTSRDEGNRQEDLSAEQVQMFEEGNQDMMKYFESMSESVQTAQKSLAEISDLQSTLIGHLSTQTEQIELLVEESHDTTENVEGGNKQLKKAAERPSTARMTFYATCGLCLTLVTWDLIF